MASAASPTKRGKRPPPGTATLQFCRGVQMDGGGDDGLGPVGGVGEVGGSSDFAALHFEEQNGLGLPACGGVGFR